MSDSEARLEFVGELGEEFVERFRRGERPAVSEYVDRHPQFAQEIRELFPALVMMEDVAPSGPSGVASRPAADRLCETIPRLGDYRVIRELGRGGMGIVYEAEQVSLGRHVALKVLPQHLLLDEKHKRRFEREARSAARLHHTNIVPVFGVGEQEGRCYYVMQFIQGLGIDEVLHELKRLRAAGRSATGQSAAATESPNLRHSDMSAACAARSLLEGHFVLPSTSGGDDAAAHLHLERSAGSSATGTAVVPELTPERDGVPTVALPQSSLVAPSSRSDTEFAEAADTFAPAGSPAPAGLRSASEAAGSRHRRLTYWKSVARIGTQVASALQYAHDQGILHRDIKPGNLLLDLRGTVWVTDFGLAKEFDQPDVTRSGDILGTLRYMPPEAFEGKMDFRSDVYSLGLTLYELLALQPAFDDSDRHKLMRLVTTAEPPRLEKINPEIPRDLATIVHKAIDRDCARRYQTAHEMQVDLERFVADEPVTARAIAPHERCWRWCRRNRALAGLWAVLFVGLTTVTGAMTFAYFREFEHRQEIENKNREISQALESEKSSKAAEGQAKVDATDRLYQSLVAQARANRLSRRIGQRLRSLKVLAEAARMAREMSLSEDNFLEIRNEAIACLTLPDIRAERQWNGWPAGTRHVALDHSFERMARVDDAGDVSVRRLGDDLEIWKLRGSGPFDAWPQFSPDGRFLAVVDWVRWRIKVWKLDRPEPDLVLDEQNSNHPAFSPDSRQLACRSGSNSILIVDLNSTEPQSTGRRQFQVGNTSGHLAWHPAGRLLAVSTPRGVQIRDAQTGDLAADLSHLEGTYHVAWDPDGRTLAGVGVERVIQIWDVASRKQTLQLKGHTGGGIQFTFSHDGNVLASMGWDGTLRLWDPRTGELLFQTPLSMSQLLFSADDRLLAASVSAAQSQLGLVEIFPTCAYRTLVRDPALGKGGYQVASTSSDDRLLAVGMHDGVAIWDLLGGHSLAFLPSGKNHSVLFEPSGALLCQGPSGVVRRAMLSDPTPDTIRLGAPQSLPLEGTINRLSSSRDGGVLAKSMGGGGLVWRQDRGSSTLSVAPHYDARYIAVSPDGSLVATGSHSGAGVRVWNALTGELIRELPAIGRANVEFSPDGRWLAATGGKLWETDSWTQVRPLDQCVTLVFSPDSKILAMETGVGIIRLIDPESGREYARLEDPHQDRARELCFTHDGAQLVATDTDSSTVHVWDLRAIRQELRLLDLDWDLPPYPISAAERDRRPLLAIEEESPSNARPIEQSAKSRESWYASATTETYRSAVESNPGEVSFGRGWATLALDSGDTAAYRKACEHLRDRFGKSDNWFHQVHVCWSFMLSDDSVADKGFLLELGTSLTKTYPDVAWTHTALAGTQLRNGAHEAALRSLDESERLGHDWHARVTNDFLRAIALARLGRPGEARVAFDQGAAYADAHLVRTPQAPFGEIPAVHSLDWHAIRILRREAATLLHTASNQK